MTMRARLKELTGEWRGLNKLWLMPEDPVRESDTTASIRLVANGAFVSISYTWAESGEPQDGVLIVRTGPEPDKAEVVWVDSFHTGGRFMVFDHEKSEDDRLSVLTTYPAPSGPDWGWRIVLSSGSPEEFVIQMFNIMPDHPAMLAVDARYSKSSTI
jgi:hypothetical protein